MAEESEVTRLVRASADGCEKAWGELVHRYAPLVMAVTRSFQLSVADAQDVSQTVWLQLVRHLPHIREPEALPGWLSTTTQRECRRLVRLGRRVQPVDPQAACTLELTAPGSADARILRAELRQSLRDGLAELPERDRLLLQLRAADPPMSYREIGDLLGMRPGSIGPTIRRCLNRLRESNAMRAYLSARATADGGMGGDGHEFAGLE